MSNMRSPRIRLDRTSSVDLNPTRHAPIVAAGARKVEQGASFRSLRLIGRQCSDALPTLAGLLIKVMQQTCPRILADYLRTAEPQTPSDLRKRADSDVEAESVRHG